MSLVFCPEDPGPIEPGFTPIPRIFFPLSSPGCSDFKLE